MSTVRRWLVVGGGTAGCVVARGLARCADNHVVLLERGIGVGRSGAASSFDDLATGGPWEQLAVTDDGRPRLYPLGSGLGGTSRLNGAVVGIGALPVGARADAGPHDDHGSAWAGELVSDDELGVIDHALLAAAPDAERVRLLRRRGRLLDTASATRLSSGRSRNLSVRTGCAVHELDMAGDRARGVVLADGERLTGDAVVLCAGAIGSAALLLRAGVAVAGLGAVRQHAGRLVDLVLGDGVPWDPRALVTGVALRRGAAEVLALNHRGPGLVGRGALLVGWLAGNRRGSISVGDDPAAAPAVDFGALAGTTDAAGLARAEELLDDVLGHASFRAVVREYRRSAVLDGYFHAGSSCARGVVLADDNSVAGCRRLFVADASALPDLPIDATMLAAVCAEASRFASRWAHRDLD